MLADILSAVLLFAAVFGIPAVILTRSGYGKKRGCGRGCATCGNRHICHPGDYSTPENIKRDLPSQK